MIPVRLLLVDDQALFREGLRTLLSLHPDFEVVGEAGDGEEALRKARGLRPDVALVDLKMPLCDGVTATRRLRAELPSCKVIVLTTFDDDELVFDGLRAGAVGYLLKGTTSERLAEAIRSAVRGGAPLEPNVARKVVEEFARLAPTAPRAAAEPLSEREREVLALLARGASNKAIAASLGIAEGTVKNHVTNLFAKLRVSDRTQAALLARDLGLLPPSK